MLLKILMQDTKKKKISLGMQNRELQNTKSLLISKNRRGRCIQ